MFGHSGLLLLQPIRLNGKMVSKYKLFLKRSARRSDKTLRKSWFNLFPHVPVSRKAKGSRMGKGKGKLACWATEVPAGLCIVELKNLRYGRAKYFCNQVSHRIPGKTKFIVKYQRRVNLTLNPSKEIFYDVMW